MTSPKRLSTAIIGLGRIAWSDHIPALQRHPELFSLDAVIDPLPERRQDTCQQFQIARNYASLQELYAAETPDLLIVTSPTVFHAEHTIYALEHGSNVFCDKPVAITVEETRKMQQTAERCGKKLMVFQPRRLEADSLAIRQILQSGKLGPLFQMQRFVGAYAVRTDWQAFRKNGGGMLRNYGAHYVDQFYWLLQEKLQLLSCEAKRILSAGDADDVVQMSLRSASGVLLDLNINQAAAIQPFRWLLYGKYGAAMVSGWKNDWTLRYVAPEQVDAITAEQGFAASGRKYPSANFDFREEIFHATPPAQQPIDQFLLNYHAWLQGTASPLVPFRETLEHMELLDNALRLSNAL